jgi:hypothetical protein
MMQTVTARQPPFKSGRARTFNTHCCPLSISACRALVYCLLGLGDCQQHSGEGRMHGETACGESSARQLTPGGSRRDSRAAAHEETAWPPEPARGETAARQNVRAASRPHYDRAAKQPGGGCARGGCAARRPHGKMLVRPIPRSRGLRRLSHSRPRTVASVPLKSLTRHFGRFVIVSSVSDRAAAARVKECNPRFKLNASVARADLAWRILSYI